MSSAYEDQRLPSPPPAPPRATQAAVPAPGVDSLEQDLDDCQTLGTLTSAVQVLTAMPQHPSADALVQTLQQLARACRRRVRYAQAEPAPGQASARAERPAWESPAAARAERLAEQAEHVARWAREQVLGGDPGVLDDWLTRQRQAAPGKAGRPEGGPAPAPQVG